jgi:hypothetical protein
MMGAARCTVLYRFFEKMIAAHSCLTVHFLYMLEIKEE